MSLIKKLIDKYSDFVTKNSFFVFGIVILVFILAINLSSNVGVKSMDNADTLPDGIEVMDAFEILENSFGGSDSIMFAIEIEPSFPDSVESRDIRDYKYIEYIDVLTKAASHTTDVQSLSSPSSVLKNMNNGVLPKSNRIINEYVENNAILDQYISEDKSMALIKMSLSDDYSDEELVKELELLIQRVPKPSGIVTNVAGSVATGPVVNAQIGPDMAKTSRFSMIGIVVILLILFRSLRYGLTPLGVIGVGITWAFGYMGLMSMNISSASSGAISMIMGIGIDFGIQIVTRYRFELQSQNYKDAMRITLESVFVPMATTTLAALIGFKAMSMGQLTFMAELGSIMSYGVASCFLAAITVVPSILIITEILCQNFFDKPNKKMNSKKKKKRKLKNPVKIMGSIIDIIR